MLGNTVKRKPDLLTGKALIYKREQVQIGRIEKKIKIQARNFYFIIKFYSLEHALSVN